MLLNKASYCPPLSSGQLSWWLRVITKNPEYFESNKKIFLSSNISNMLIIIKYTTFFSALVNTLLTA